MCSVASVLICSSVEFAGQRPGSTSTSPLATVGSSSAAASGNEPDCECPINTAPFNWVARSDNAFSVGFGVGYAAKTHIGDTLLCEFVHGGHWELTIRVGSARLRAEVAELAATVYPRGVPKVHNARERYAGAANDGIIDAVTRLLELMAQTPRMSTFSAPWSSTRF